MIPMNDLKRIERYKCDNFLLDVASIVKSGTYLDGVHTSRFVALLSESLGHNPVVPLGSGTAALELAFRALSLPPKSKVGLVANAGAYGSIALYNTGLVPVYIDVHPEDALIDIERLKEAASYHNLQAVLVTHLYGNTVNMEKVKEIAFDFNFLLIEDCAQSLGGNSCGRAVGTFGELSTFSFYPTKNLGGFGDAGAISGNAKHLVNVSRILARYGWEEKYCISMPGGTNSRMDEVQAAFLNLGLKELEKLNTRRRSIASKYALAFENLPIRVLTKSSDSDAPHLFVICTNSLIERENLRHHLKKQRVSTAVHYPIPDNKQLGFSGWIKSQTLETTEMLANRVVSLPFFAGMTDSEVDTVIEEVITFYESN